jgi:hypothetical protein
MFQWNSAHRIRGAAFDLEPHVGGVNRSSHEALVSDEIPIRALNPNFIECPNETMHPELQWTIQLGWNILSFSWADRYGSHATQFHLRKPH